MNVANGAGFYLDGEAEIGPLRIQGAQPGTSNLDNGLVTLSAGAAENSGDGEPVSLSHVYFSGAGMVGALRTSDASLEAGGTGAHAGTLEATSLTLDSASSVGFEVRGTAPTPGGDYGEIISRGPVDLAGAFVAMYMPKPCEAPPIGQVYTLLSASGELTGSFDDAPEGAEIPVEFFKECGVQPAENIKVEYHRGGPTNTVTATVVGPTDVESPPIPANPPSKFESTPPPWVSAAAGEEASRQVAAAEAERRMRREAENRDHPPATATGSLNDVSLAGTALTVKITGATSVKLACKGGERCVGKLTLAAKSSVEGKAGKRSSSAMTTIGTAKFSIAAGETATIKLTLNAAGRALLVAGHGHLSARLTLVQTEPENVPSQTKTVSLTPAKTRSKAKKS